MAHHSGESLWPQYEVMDFIGEGGFSQIRKARHRLTGLLVAIKILDKEDRRFCLMNTEVDILQMLEHPNIVSLFQVIVTDKKIYLVLELCEKTLGKHMSKSGMGEEKVRTIFLQILEAMRYCHDLGVAHRDLKPNNIMLSATGKVSIIDFGLATKVSPGQKCTNFCGTFRYGSPEVLNHIPYDATKKDVWALGVLLYHMATGTFPFQRVRTDQQQRENLIQGKYHVPDHLSEELRDLIRDLLTVDPEKRRSVKELMTHPWLQLGQEGASPLQETFPRELDPAILAAMEDMGFHPGDTRHSILQRTFDKSMATYRMLEYKAKVKAVSPALTPVPSLTDPADFPLLLKERRSQSVLPRDQQPEEGQVVELKICSSASDPKLLNSSPQKMPTDTPGTKSLCPVTIPGTSSPSHNRKSGEDLRRPQSTEEMPVASTDPTHGQGTRVELPEETERPAASPQGSRVQLSGADLLEKAAAPISTSGDRPAASPFSHDGPEQSAASICGPEGSDQLAASPFGSERLDTSAASACHHKGSDTSAASIYGPKVPERPGSSSCGPECLDRSAGCSCDHEGLDMPAASTFAGEGQDRPATTTCNTEGPDRPAASACDPEGPDKSATSFSGPEGPDKPSPYTCNTEGADRPVLFTCEPEGPDKPTPSTYGTEGPDRLEPPLRGRRRRWKVWRRQIQKCWRRLCCCFTPAQDSHPF